MPCDSLPSDECRYSEEADQGGEKLENDAWGKEEWKIAQAECQVRLSIRAMMKNRLG